MRKRWCKRSWAGAALSPFFSWIFLQWVAHSRCFLFFFLGGVSSSSVGARAMMLDSFTLNS